MRASPHVVAAGVVGTVVAFLVFGLLLSWASIRESSQELRENLHVLHSVRDDMEVLRQQVCNEFSIQASITNLLRVRVEDLMDHAQLPRGRNLLAGLSVGPREDIPPRLMRVLDTC